MHGDSGGFIHDGDPFAVPGAERDPVRQLRGRLAAAVTLWTAANGDHRAGLTVSSVTMSEPGALAVALSEDSDLFDVLQSSGRCVVHVLDWAQRQVADRFGYLTPAPGGPFTGEAWTATEWGPLLGGVGTWAGCRLESTHPFGYAHLLVVTVEHAEAGSLNRPLVWHRGRYRGLA